MELYLLRHGIAEDHAASGRDEDRRLTDEGREKLRRVLERAHGAGVAPTLILSSPFKRALQTAEIAASQLGYEGKIARTAALTPDSSPEAVWNEVREHRGEGSILLAGHEPLFSATTSYLLGSTRLIVEFKKAGLVRIDIHGFGAAPMGMLQWMMVPKLA